MLKIHIPEQTNIWDEKKEEFVNIKAIDLQLEHSLISLSKWEAKWHKPFLGKNDKTKEEILDYIRCMTITQNVDPMIYEYIPNEKLKEIFDYIENPMTATWFSGGNTDNKNGKVEHKEAITAEIIYYWMITLNIPVKFEGWHLNRLITLIRVINIKNAPPKKMSKKEILERNAKINAARRAKYRSKG